MKLVVVMLVLTAVASADPRPRIESMRVADDAVCNLLRAQVADQCTRLVDDKRAAVYRSGTARGITRVVVTVPTPDGVLVGPSLDFEAVGAIAATVHDATIDGRAGVAVEVVAKQDHTVIGCAPTGKTAWKCTTVTAATWTEARLSLR